MNFKSLLIAVAASTAVVASSIIATPANAAPVDIYITEGTHNVNGRQWRTSCVPYSATERCLTEIMSTQVVSEKGKFVSKTGWFFNNLTYKESPREMWAGNPLGVTGSWKDSSGRQWRTECDTAVTGSNGCRNYVITDVVVSSVVKGKTTYSLAKKEILNSMVRFTVPAPVVTVKPSAPVTVKPTPTPTPVKPTPTPTPVVTPTPTPVVTPTPTPTPTPPAVQYVTFTDNAMNYCVHNSLGLSINTPITKAAAEGLAYLNCSNGGLEDISEVTKLPNLTRVNFYKNSIRSVQPLSSLKNLEIVNINLNNISNITGLIDLPNLTELRAANNNVSDFWITKAVFTKLKVIDLSDNNLSDVSEYWRLGKVETVNLSGNNIVNVSGLAFLSGVKELNLSWNQILDVSPLIALNNLQEIRLSGNNISEMSRSTIAHWESNGVRVIH